MNLTLGENLNSAKGGLSYSVTVVLYVILNLFVGSIVQSCGLQNTDAGMYILYLLSPSAIAVAVAITLYAGKLKPKQVFPVKCKPKYYLIALLLIFGLMFSLSTVNGYLVELLKLLGYNPSTSTLPSFEGWGLVWGLLVIAFIPAVFEEALFRGVMLNNVEEDAGTYRAAFIIAFAFSLYHGSVEKTIYQFICGFAFALLALRSRSILPTIIIHFINNALIILLYAFNLVDDLGNIVMPQWAFITVTVMSALSLVAALLLLVFDKSQVKPKKKNGVAPFFIWASVGIIVMASIWIAGLIGA